MTELLVTYPGGSTVERTTVLALTRTDMGLLFAVERTPCHPESPRWPDQPADRCTLLLDGVATPIECHEGFLREGELVLGEPEREAWAGAGAEPGAGVSDSAPVRAERCVVHVAPSDLALELGAEVTLEVDGPYREAISRNHSRCHLVSLALNAALAGAWRKEQGTRDSLGSPDFDKLAIQTSTISEGGSLDVYRIGKHVRKSGFSVEALEDPQALAREVARIAGEWIASRPRMSISPAVSTLQERRTWSCPLPGATASFLCGGTHAPTIGPEDGLRVEITWEPEEKRLAMSARG
jgi:alanyl-tRNA synthetase